MTEPTPPTPSVRLATPADAEELVRLRAVMLRLVVGPTITTAPWEQACADVLRRGMEEETLAAAVAGDPADRSRLVASGVVTVAQRLPSPANPTGRVGWLASMVTEAPWRRRGLARRVATTLLDWCVAHGVDRVDLHATADGAPLYQDLGFAFRDEWPEMNWRAPASRA